MHALRSARHIARLVLAWWLVSLGVAVAAPWVQPAGMEIVCSAGGIKLLLKAPDGSEQPAGGDHTLKCPLCASLAPPPPAAAAPVPAQPLAHALRPVAAARIAAATTGLPPARAPPQLS